jgi:hypothetical protein
MRPVLGEAPVAGFDMAKLALEVSEWMLNLGPHLRNDPIDLLVVLIQFTALGSLCMTLFSPGIWWIGSDSGDAAIPSGLSVVR